MLVNCYQTTRCQSKNTDLQDRKHWKLCEF